MKISIFILFFLFLQANFFAQQDSVKLQTKYEEIICFCDSDASFRGGQDALDYWVKCHMIYPELAIKNNDKGKVYVSFIVNETGLLSDISIVKGVSKALDDEVVRLIKRMPNWLPYEYGGKKLKTRVRMIFEFKLI